MQPLEGEAPLCVSEMNQMQSEKYADTEEKG
jgi:hypothetical protein